MCFCCLLKRCKSIKPLLSTPCSVLFSVGQNLFVGAASRDWRFPLGNAQGEKVSPLMVFSEARAPRCFVMSFACLLAEVF